MRNWKIDLENRRVTHRPSGLMIHFSPALDGRGAMQADLLNPEALPATMSQEERSRLHKLPMAAWEVYAKAVEVALQQAEGDASQEAGGRSELSSKSTCRCRA